MRAQSPYIFLSHSSKNNPFVIQLADDLRAAGFTVWLDVETLMNGDRWLNEIQTAIENCHAVIVVMSRAARESEWVERETLLALELRKPLFIASIEAIPLPLQLINRQFTDFTVDYASALARLTRALEKVLVSPEPVIVAPVKGTISAMPDEDNFFDYLAQMPDGEMMALVARDLYKWAQKHADSIEFSGKMSPGFHVKIQTQAGKLLTAWSLLAFLRHPAVQIPFDYHAKYPPYSRLEERLSTLDALNRLLPEDERLDASRANRRPTLNLVSALDTAEELETFKAIMLQIMSRLKKGI